jgi:circadian clock protein KaiC
MADGKLRVLWMPSAESPMDLLAEELLSAAAAPGEKRVFIDGLDGFRSAATEPDRLDRFYTALTLALAAQGATTIVSDTSASDNPQPGVLGRAPSAFLDNVLVLRTIEKGRRMRRYISIMKLREGMHDDTTRRLRITGRGLVIGMAPARAATTKPRGTARGGRRKGGA